MITADSRWLHHWGCLLLMGLLSLIGCVFAQQRALALKPRCRSRCIAMKSLPKCRSRIVWRLRQGPSLWTPSLSEHSEGPDDSWREDRLVSSEPQPDDARGLLLLFLSQELRRLGDAWGKSCTDCKRWRGRCGTP